MILFIIILVAMVSMIIFSFTQKTKRKIIVFSVTYYLLSAVATIWGLKLIKEISLDSLRSVNRYAGFLSLCGIFISLILLLISRIIRKADDKSIKSISVSFLAGFGLVLLLISQIFSMYSYVEIDRRNLPVVTIKDVTTVSLNKEYHISDFIEVDNSHGEEFAQIVWSKDDYRNSDGIEISEDCQSFVIHDGNGKIGITILVHKSKHSDVKTIYVNAAAV